MRYGLFLAGVALAVASAVYVGQRLSTEALAVVIGIVCGVLAGIPAAVLLLVVSRRHEGGEHEGTPGVPVAYPPVLMVPRPERIGWQGPVQPPWGAGDYAPGRREGLAWDQTAATGWPAGDRR
jgi:hypothetical protein